LRAAYGWFAGALRGAISWLLRSPLPRATLGVALVFVGLAAPTPTRAAGPNRTIGIPPPFTLRRQSVCPGSGSVQGVDVSNWQGSIDWSQVAASGKTFGYVEVGDGSFVDSFFVSDYTGMKSVGMTAGGYFFFEPDQDPTAQANLFISNLREAGFAPGDLRPAFDVEVMKGQSAATVLANLQTAINVVQSNLGVTPAIYTGYDFWDYSLGGSTAFGAYPLWMAWWSTNCPSLPNGWNTWAVWQYSDTGYVPGIYGPVDLDQSNGACLPRYGRVVPRVGGAPLGYSAYLPFIVVPAPSRPSC